LTPLLQNVTKTKEALSSTEERLKQAKLDMQRLQMDLTARGSECAGLEERVKELERSGGALKSSNEDLAAGLKSTQEQLAAAEAQRDRLQGALPAPGAACWLLLPRRCVVSLAGGASPWLPPA
jgi:chromosome segregation ATPase